MTTDNQTHSAASPAPEPPKSALTAVLAEAEKFRLKCLAGNIFRPTAPIDDQTLFSGRTKQRGILIDVICQRGQHGIVYGERGVGKTSLANVLSPYLESMGNVSVIAPHVNCDTGDDFSSLWKKVFGQIRLTRKRRNIGFVEGAEDIASSAVDALPEKISPDDVQHTLSLLGGGAVLVIIIDEFDRLPREHTRLFADTIKTLSDYSIPATILLVGVADNVGQLLEAHESIERAIVQVPMPRMSKEELQTILTSCMQKIGVTMKNEVTEAIAELSHGLPHYTHLLGQYSTWEAIDDGKLVVALEHLQKATQRALENTNQSIKELYHKATSSPRKDCIFKEVLLACSLAEVDGLGYFAAADVRTPLQKIAEKPYGIAAFTKHLHAFCEKERGSILERTGQKFSYRFRFRNPLLQPYVILLSSVASEKNAAG